MEKRDYSDRGILKITVIKTDNIGDAVLASPFFFALRNNFKKARITAILSPAGREVLDGLNIADEINVFDPAWLKYEKKSVFARLSSALKLAALISSTKPEIAISLRHQDRLSSLALSLSRAKIKIGYDVKSMGFGITNRVKLPAERVHEAEKILCALRALLPEKKFPLKIGFTIEPEDRARAREIMSEYGLKKFAVIHPVSGHPSKDWGIENYVSLAAKLAKKNRVVIIGGPGDKGARGIKGRNIVNLTGVMSIRETGALIKKSALLIGNDSSGAHIAAAVGAKSLTIFSGAADYREFGALGKRSFIITNPVPCSPCRLIKCPKEKHFCMEISPGFVHGIARKIISGTQKNRVILPGKAEAAE